MLRKKNLKRHGFAPLVIGHRGAKGRAPENTMAAFRKGVSLGADVLECDVHFSSDERLVVIHDESVDRTTNGFGLVRELTLEEIRSLDAGERERVPTLDELLDWLKDQRKVGLTVEIKMDLSVYPGISEAVVDAIRASNLLNRVGVISFDYAAVEEVKDLCPEIATGILFDQPLPDPIFTARAIQADSIVPSLNLLSRELIDQAWKADLAVITWLANTEDHIRLALDLKVDGIASDFPDLVRAAVDRRYPQARSA